MSIYEETIEEVLRVATEIPLAKSEGDGRIDSAVKEGPFLNDLKRRLLESHSDWEIVISPARAACDVMINQIRINLKLTDCKSSDNSANKPSIFYSMTGITTYPYSSTWNDFFERLQQAKSSGQIKQTRHRPTEYHYLVKNKLTGEVLLKPIFDIHTYVSNPSNDLQINWKHEFAHAEYLCFDENYIAKVKSLLVCLQTSVRMMIERTRKFADADMAELFTRPTSAAEITPDGDTVDYDFLTHSSYL